MHEKNDKNIEQNSFAEVRLPRRTPSKDKPAIVIQSSKGRVFIHNHTDPDLLKALLADL